MELSELESVHQKLTKEKEVVEEKLHKIERLHKEIKEEFEARSNALYCIERLINLKEN